jgi:RHS repeat-associated protein
MTVPIATSSGRSGFGPQLNLAYDSGSGNGPFGFGWSLSIPSITRKTDKGLPQYDDANESDVFILSGAEDLVLVTPQPSFPPVSGYIIKLYRPRSEGLFVRIERWTDTSDGEVYWRSISKDNITTFYGKSLNSRIADPNDPSCTKRIFSWLICESYDDKGNDIFYEYAEENANSVDQSQANEMNRIRIANRYLKRIHYGNRVSRLQGEEFEGNPDWMFEVVFDYGEGHYQVITAPGEDPVMVSSSLTTTGEWPMRLDHFSSYRAGYEVRTYRLCQRVLMFHHFETELGTPDCLVRSTEFSYSENPIGSFMTSVTQSGYILNADGSYNKKSLPPLEFGYSQAAIQNEIMEIDPASLENLPVGLDGSQYQWVDLDGEGLSGILTEQAGSWFYKRNLSANNLVPDNGTNRTVPQFGPLELVAAKPNAALSSGVLQFLGLSGGGQLDLVAFKGTVPGYYKRTEDQGWEPFSTFKALPNIPWNDPDLRFVDLTGDGHADILITEDNVFTWYPSLAEAGFDRDQRTFQAFDEEQGPHLVFADGTQSIYLGDLSGDGLSDLVRIRNGEVCYWPNLGYGRFGAKVTMDNSPWFDAPDLFDQKRIRLADIDGSGTTDIIYLGGQGVAIYCNECGNAWSDPEFLTSFPRIDDLSSVVATDLLGNGTACLVWSSALPGDSRRPMRYIALMQEKPHLLTSTKNNLGAETAVHYAPSTKFYLQDKLNGNPWITRLPFPVQVVERVETYDWISQNLFVTRYTYHHGYFDGIEREFRGFGMVEQWDTEEIGAAVDETTAPENTNWDAASLVPPALTRTWFHTGAFFEGAKISRQFEAEYYHEEDANEGEPGLSDPQFVPMLLPDTVLPVTLRLADGTQTPYALTGDEMREACRSLKGSILRQEVYGLDGTDKADRPYSASERNYTIELLQPQGANPYAVFFTHARETVDFHYERELYKVCNGDIVDPDAPPPNSTDAADPRVTHTLTLEVDDYGDVLQSVAIGYGRRYTDPSVGSDDQGKQTQTHITYTENKYTNPIPDPDPLIAVQDPDAYRAPLLYESQTFEVLNITYTSLHAPPIIPGITNLFQFDEIAAQVQAACDGAHDLPYEDFNHTPSATDPPYRRPIEHTRTLFRANDLTGLLTLGKLQSLALPGETYKLAFTPTLITNVFNTRVTEGMLQEGGYCHSESDTNWWIPSGRVFYSPDLGDAAAAELLFAQGHFFLPNRFSDPFGNETCLAYDGNPAHPKQNHNLLLVETRDPLGNIVTVNTRDDEGNTDIRNDYRVLQPAWVTDPNGNRTRVAFDALGLVVATAMMGKPGDKQGDLLDDTFDPDPTLSTIQTFLQDPIGKASGRLGNATTCIVYDIDRYRRCQQPPFAVALARELHASEPGGDTSPVQIHFVYSDGFEREIQTKIQAETGDAPARNPNISITTGDPPKPTGDILPGDLVRDTSGNIIQANSAPRWVGTGRTVFNNKGKPIKKYEPFFSSTHLYEPEPDMTDTGVTPVLFYDPVERVVTTLHPNHTYEKVVFDPWIQTSWDGNDTVTGDPRTDVDIGGYVGAYFTSLPAGWQTWYAQRQAGALGAQELDAAQKAAKHANTPAVAFFDMLGRTFLTVADNGPDNSGNEQKLETRIEFDVEGNQRTVIDALGRIVMRYDYDILGNRIHQVSMEASKHWMLYDVNTKPVYTWESRGHTFHTQYDPLRRPIRSYVNGIDPGDPTSTILFERIVYGEQHPDDLQFNLRGKIFLQLDQAGAVTNLRYDFKGNLLRGTRHLVQNYQKEVDWKNVDAQIPGDSHLKVELATLESELVSYVESETFTSATSYDALNRSSQIVAPYSDQPSSLRINVIQPTYNEASLLERMDVWLGRSTDPTGLLDPTSMPPSQVGITNIDYNAKGLRTLIDYANGAGTTYEYDMETFRLIHLRTTRPTGLNGLTSQLFGNPATVQDLHYTYDPVGNITYNADDAIQTVTFKNQTVDPNSDYTYDATYRLLSATGREHIGQTAFDFTPPDGSYRDYPFMGLRASPTALRNYTETYSYDEVGNIQNMQHAAAGGSWTRTYTYSEPSLLEPGKNKNNRLTRTNVGGTHEIYNYRDAQSQDMDGCMTGINSMQMTWDFKDQLQQVNLVGGGIAYYLYDASGQRVRKVIQRQNGSKQKERIYLGGFEVYREYNGATGTTDLERQTLHIMDDKQRIALVETRTDTEAPQLIRFQFGNHLGSASLELDETGQVISYEEYYPYGSTSYQAVCSQTETPKRYRYTGKERDEESGLYYHGARYYAPWLGRWTSCDPSGITDGQNVYVYGHSNPNGYSDLTGQAAEQNTDLLGEQPQNPVCGYPSSDLAINMATVDCTVPPDASTHRKVIKPPFDNNLPNSGGTPPTSPTSPTSGNDDPTFKWPSRPYHCPGSFEPQPYCPPHFANSPDTIRKPEKQKPPTEVTFDDNLVEGTRTKTEDTESELRDIESQIRKLEPKLHESLEEAESASLGAIPFAGWAFAVVYDLSRGDVKHATLDALKKGIEKAGENLIGDVVPIVGWVYEGSEATKELQKAGPIVDKMRQLKERRYQFKDRLGHPDARYDIPGGRYYLGPGGKTYDVKTHKPISN